MSAKSIKAASQELIVDALEFIEFRYGERGTTPKSYHNAQHTADVIDAAMNIGTMASNEGRIPEKILPLIGIAAAYHDIEQNFGIVVNEQKSANYAHRAMKETGLFNAGQILLVRQMILASQARVDSDKIIQYVPEENYPAKILADADLSHLGKEFVYYWDNAFKLFKEDFAPEERTGKCLAYFVALQPKILRNHVFYTPEADKLFPHKAENIVRLLKMILQNDIRMLKAA